MTLHVMVDLETLSTAPTAAFCAIGAVAFDPEEDGLPPLEEMRESDQKFYSRVNLDSCLRYGLKVDGSTVAWWLRQEPEAQREMAAAVEGGYDLLSALWSFKEWYKRVRPTRIWSHGSVFDITILDHAYSVLSWHSPWVYQNVRDTRTRLEDTGVKYKAPETGRHNALVDAYYQALCIQSTYLKKKGA